MSSPQPFGPYLLLKKLSEDPLGETFRAGLAGPQGMERVVLLRVFNGHGIQGTRLWETAARRAGLYRSLKSPNVGQGVELGEVRGVPFVACDYISGRNLGALLGAVGGRSPLPADHALLIAERVALALAVGCETRIGEERVLHGFVVPDLVMLSNEGDVRLLGFEVGPALRQQLAEGALRGAYDGYLAPEALAGQPPQKCDDVFSAAALLFELLTGKPLPPAAAEGYGPIVATAVLAADGSSLPADIAGLLARGLAPREQRVADAVAWHGLLAKLMSEGHYDATTFNLAFFLHNLFRPEIEAETQELAAERVAAPATLAPAPIPMVPPAPPGPQVAPAPAAAPSPATPPASTPTADGSSPSRPLPAEERSRTAPWLGLAAALLLALGLGGFVLWGQPDAEPFAAGEVPPPPARAVTAPAGTASRPEALTANGGGPVAQTKPAAAAGRNGLAGDRNGLAAGGEADVEAQIQRLVEERLEGLDASLKAEYDRKLAELQRQLEQAREAGKRPPGEALADSGSEAAAGNRNLLAGDRNALAGDRNALAGDRNALAGDPETRGGPELARRDRVQSAESVAAGEATEPTGPAARVAKSPAAPAGGESAAEAASEPDRVQLAAESPRSGSGAAVPAVLPPAAAALPETAGETPPSSRSQRQPEPSLVNPQIVRRPDVRGFFPPVARRLNKSATVVMSLRIDERGEVAQVERVGPEAGFGFDQAAVEVARATAWTPATRGGIPVEAWVELKLEFQP